MRVRVLLLALLLLAACGEPGPTQAFQPVADAPATATEVVVTTTAVTLTDHSIDPTLRNPFEQP